MLLALIAAQKAAPYQCICHPSTSYPAAIYHLDVRVSISDVMFDHASSPSAILITIKASKTDPFRKGITLALGRTYCPLCPVAAMAVCLQRGTGSGPPFRFKDGEPLTCKKSVDQVKKGLTAARVDQNKYNRHSF